VVEPLSEQAGEHDQAISFDGVPLSFGAATVPERLNREPVDRDAAGAVCQRHEDVDATEDESRDGVAGLVSCEPFAADHPILRFQLPRSNP
jgi:hypothetical protein